MNVDRILRLAKVLDFSGACVRIERGDGSDENAWYVSARTYRDSSVIEARYGTTVEEAAREVEHALANRAQRKLDGLEGERAVLLDAIQRTSLPISVDGGSR